ncbi:MAG: hypothetical protein RLZZ628_2105 [Bacteroidota bacterium]|jgi:hypothetical protein
MRSLILKTSILTTLCLGLQECLFAQKAQFGLQIGSGISFTHPEDLAVSKDSIHVGFSQPTALKIGLTAKLPFKNWFVEFGGDYCWNPMRRFRWTDPIIAWRPPFPFPPGECPMCGRGIDLLWFKEILFSVSLGRQITKYFNLSAGVTQRTLISQPNQINAPVLQPNSTVYQLKVGYEFTNHLGLYADYSDLFKASDSKSESKTGFSNGAKRLNVGLNVRF